LSAGDQALAAGANLVNYIRGDRTNEGALADNTKYYRQRLHLLGDIVNSESAYVKGGMAFFGDPGYGTFKTSAAVTSRKGIVYVGANDGMLHAFRAADDTSTTTVDEGGQEEWAYIPGAVMPNLHTLADKGYGINPLHQYYVDGTPVTSDICISACGSETLAVWKTILVGSLNRGGRGYFALDITDPNNPQGLWEFTNANMGYSYGNPKIAKMKDGRWVVLVTSGYNNAPPDAPSGDGKGHLYVLEAYTGTVITDISTGAGSLASPSGLARIDAALSEPGIDATVLVVYGGDLEGNLWRFDINGTDTQVPARWPDIGAAGIDAQLLATLRGPTGNVQPITSKPLLTLAGNNLVVIIGTGRYLGSSDLVDASQQSLYAIKDPFPTGTTPSVAIWGNPRTEGTFVQQIQTTGTCPAGSAADICSAGQSVVISTNKPVEFSTDGGWYFDFAHSGERVNTDPDISEGSIVLTANIPNSSSCTVGGESYFYTINYLTGGSLTTSGVIGRKFGNELASNPKVIHLPNGETKTCVQGSAGGDPLCLATKTLSGGATIGNARRISWRELTPN
jgi:type IV pilus assembly protein PilY1